MNTKVDQKQNKSVRIIPIFIFSSPEGLKSSDHIHTQKWRFDASHPVDAKTKMRYGK